MGLLSKAASFVTKLVTAPVKIITKALSWIVPKPPEIPDFGTSDFILGLSNFTEETDVTKTSLVLTLSAADLTFVSTVLNENVVNDSVDIFRGFLDDSNALIADPFLLYSGQIDTFSITERGEESTVNLTIVSHWADFDKTNGRKTNNTSQQRFFTSDVGMDFSSQTVRDIKWGRA